MSKDSLLIVNQSAPYGNANAKEALDLALAAATFDQDVQLLYTGDACYQLINRQEPEHIDTKNITKMLKALPIYGIEEIYVDEDKLQQLNINKLANGLSVKIVGNDEIKQLYTNAKTVIRF